MMKIRIRERGDVRFVCFWINFRESKYLKKESGKVFVVDVVVVIVVF